MPTMESLAIREELARNRIAAATEQLSAQLGKPVPSIGSKKAKDPKARGAQMAEETANILESLLGIVVEVDEARLAELDKQKTKAEGDGSDNNDGSGSDPAQSTKEPIKRSQTKRKR